MRIWAGPNNAKNMRSKYRPRIECFVNTDNENLVGLQANPLLSKKGGDTVNNK